MVAGHAYRATLPDDAVRAARRVPGVDSVKDDVKTLPASMFDDDIRRRVFYAIDTDAFLGRYRGFSGTFGVENELVVGR